MGVHWAQKAKFAKHWYHEVNVALGPNIPPAPLKKAKLTLTRCSSICPDSDGLVSSFKHIIDGLVRGRVLVNDKFENIGMPEYLWEKAAKGSGHVKIKVQEII